MVKVTSNKTQVVQYLRENQRNVRGPEESRRIRPVQPFVGCPGSALGIPRKWRNLLGRSGTSWRSSGFLPNEGSRKSTKSSFGRSTPAAGCPVYIASCVSVRPFFHELRAPALRVFFVSLLFNGIRIIGLWYIYWKHFKLRAQLRVRERAANFKY